MSGLVAEKEALVADRDQAGPRTRAHADEAGAWQRFRRERAAQDARTLRRHWRDEEGL